MATIQPGVYEEATKMDGGAFLGTDLGSEAVPSLPTGLNGLILQISAHEYHQLLSPKASCQSGPDRSLLSSGKRFIFTMFVLIG
jgi:hypothetical protein